MHVIVINLDYEFNQEEVCSQLWNKINEAMIGAGFRPQGRSFFINLPENEANALAREIMDDLDQKHDFEKDNIYAYLKCFYSFQMEHISNLLLPESDKIKVTNGIKFHDISS